MDDEDPHQMPENAEPRGLSQAEAERRLLDLGPNRLEKVESMPMAFRLLREFTHFFALILWLAAALAFFAEWREPGQGMAILGYAVLCVILVNGLFSFFQEYRAEKALEALSSLLPRHAIAVRDGIGVLLPVGEIVPGDLLLLSEGDDVPADCRLVEAYGVRVNAANLTGESRPQPRSSPGDVLNAGTSLVSGKAMAMVYATGMNTEFGNIARLTQTIAEPPSPLQKEIARLSRLIALFALSLGIIFFLAGSFIGLSFWEDLLFAIGVIVANVPEGLLPTVTLALAMATQRMAKKNALVRHLSAVETLGSASVICSDKTGTLTENRMSAGKACYSGNIGPPEDLPMPMLSVMKNCHDLRAVKQGEKTLWQGDPTEIALLESTPPGVPEYPRLSEIPFDTGRRRMSVVCETPEGATLYCKGAAESVLPLCSHVWSEGSVLPLDDTEKLRLMGMHEEMAREGLRVLALSYRVGAELAEGDMVFSGFIGLRDPPRAGVADAMRSCREAGIRVIMITGDHQNTASALAKEIGLAMNPVTVTGERLAQMSGAELELLLDEPELIFARAAAEHKLRIVEALQRKGEVVAVTGDGVNDAPALKRADVGIAMGIAGSDVAKESADIILLDDNFASIVLAIEEGRAVYDNLQKFLVYILTHNVAELVPYLAFALFKVPLPLTVMQILAIDLGTDTLPALALGAERPDSDAMRRPPRKISERLLSSGMMSRVYLFLGPMEALAAMAAYFYVLRSGGWHSGLNLAASDPLYMQATTACLSAIIAMQVVNIFLCRHPSRPAFSIGFNGMIAYGIAFELVLLALIDYTPWGNRLFGTAPMGADVWLYILFFMPLMLLMEELRKFVVRRMSSVPRL